MFQGLDCSSLKALRELASERRETVWFISDESVRVLVNLSLSTRGFEIIYHLCLSSSIHKIGDIAICICD